MESELLRMPQYMMTRALVPSFREEKQFPHNLGNFQLDNHNVEEWSDSNDPNLKHRARKEIGKWVNHHRNADIQIQRHDDSTASAKGHANQRTEIIQGSSPHSKFEIVRTERECERGGGEEGGQSSRSRISSMSTSYQMSSSRGMRFTSKTTSNKTSTTTTTLSSPKIMDKADDFETLKIEGPLLDNSTQRERINVGRSGTMGIRRPPTRKGNNGHKDPETFDTSKSLGHDPSSVTASALESDDLSIVSVKTISPKILVGFPAEIQVELRHKLSERDFDRVTNDDTRNVETEKPSNEFQSPPASTSTNGYRTVSAIFQNPTPIDNFRRFRKSSHGSSTTVWDPIESSSNSQFSALPVRPMTSIERDSKQFPDEQEPNISYVETFTPSALSRSWDLMQKLATHQKLDIHKKAVTVEEEEANEEQWSPISETMDLPTEPTPAKSSCQRTWGDEPTDVMSHKDKLNLDDLEPNTEEYAPLYFEKARNPFKFTKVEETKQETSVAKDLGSEKLNDWESEWEKTKLELSRLNESIDTPKFNEKNLILLDDSSSKSNTNPKGGTMYPFSARNYLDEDKKESSFNGMGILSSGGTYLGRYNYNPADTDQDSIGTKVSQTWISSLDTEKPSKHAHDNELSTSISATKGLRKVEFCKTEVHFTPEPGKFHIVESDENKPSTVHLFRRRKRKTSIERGQVDDIYSRETQTVETAHRKVNDLGNTILQETPLVPANDTNNYSHLTNGIKESQRSKPEKMELLWNELDEMDFEEDQIKPIPRTSSYEELKIQKYLNQLRTSSNMDSSRAIVSHDPNYAHNQNILDKVRADYEETAVVAEDEDAAEEDELHFRYGSFVPLATRQSLIEMNNRNRMSKYNNSNDSNLNSQMSDVSSTASSYSLPHSDHSKDIYAKAIPIRPFVNLYEEDNLEPPGRYRSYQDFRDHQHNTFGDKESTSMMEDRGRDRLKSLRLQSYDGSSERLSQIPEPILPFDLPLNNRSGRRSFSASPIRESQKRHPKPPTPILPIQFTTFERAGEAMRSRLISKTPKCTCAASLSIRQEQEDDGIYNYNTENKTSADQIFLKASALPTLKTVVNIVNDDLDGTEVEGINIDNGASTGNTTSNNRSITFPKSNLVLEPEWVSKARAKAKSRETGGIEWTQIGRYQMVKTNPETNNIHPPWISELKIRSRHSPITDDSVPKPTIVYPWQRDIIDKSNGHLEQHNEIVDPPEQISVFYTPAISPQSPSTELLIKPTFKSTSIISSSANNRSIVDLNRDLESITINPNQIELAEDDDGIATPKNTTLVVNPPKPYGSITGRGGNKARRNSSNSASGKASPNRTESRTNEKKVSKTGGESDHSGRKPLQTSTSVNQNLTRVGTPENGGGGESSQKPKTPPKPPKPPQRISSLLKSTTVLNTNASLEKKKKLGSPAKKSSSTLTQNGVDSVTVLGDTSRTPSSSSSPTIHRHPTVKISKLPMRNSSMVTKSPSPDAMEPMKKKSHVLLMTEAKRICKGKPTKSVTETRGLTPKALRQPSPVSSSSSASPQQRKR